MDNVAELSRKLAAKCDRAIRLLERKQNRTLEQDLRDMHNIGANVYLTLAVYAQNGGNTEYLHPHGHLEDIIRLMRRNVVSGNIESARENLLHVAQEFKRSMEQEIIKPCLLRDFGGIVQYNRNVSVLDKIIDKTSKPLSEEDAVGLRRFYTGG